MLWEGGQKRSVDHLPTTGIGLIDSKWNLMESNKRWTAGRKAEIVLQLIKNESQLVDICREHDLKQSEVDTWIEEFLQGGKENLKTNSKQAQSAHQKEVKQLQAKVGELVMELEARKKWQAMWEDQEEKPF